MSSLCLGVHVRTRPAALLLCCKSVSNSYFKPVRLRFSTKGDPITASFFSEEPLLKLSRVLTAGTRRHADTRHAAKSSCSWDRTTAERPSDRTNTGSNEICLDALQSAVRLQGRTHQRRSPALFNQQTCDQIRFCLQDELVTKSSWFL